ncbi:AGE family epimerase/isomerase [Paenibacillus kobensis]|uniref:AGE family epimerase/isomerase n=1 Tax=Paenibacillus kobensis TaxID=59841 RepID=UPI000FDA1B54|nr:AGE family epimerase/isomerase [Paenibacillus kobensis]
MMTGTETAPWKAEWSLAIMNELNENILAFWMDHTVDPRGGFIGRIDDERNADLSADKSLVLNTRVLWTFSTAYRLFGQPEHLSMADRAYQYLINSFLDQEYGGMYWMVEADGTPSAVDKVMYGQAFAIYALSEYYRAAGTQESLEHAIQLFELLENHARDYEFGGYAEGLAQDWTPISSMSLDGRDELNVRKSMNTHLHVMEAYSNLYRVWPAARLQQSLAELIELTIRYIIDPVTLHFKLFFDEQWNSKNSHISYGHDIEGSWLLIEAAETLGEPELLAKARETAVRMAEAVLQEGVDADGGIPNEADDSGIIDSDRDWWPQAEAVVGFYQAYQLTGESRYLEASRASWSFIERYIVDRRLGEWHWSVTREGIPTQGRGKVNAWKCPYHNSRACFEMLDRLARP